MRTSLFSSLLLLLLGMLWIPSARAQLGNCTTYLSGYASASNPKKMNFSAQAFNGGGGTNFSFAWDFGDGTTGTGATPSHTYSQVGFYQVCVTATDVQTGCVAQDCQYVVTANHTQCSATVSNTNQPNGVVDFSVSGLAGASYLWDFGDGSAYGTTQNPSHTYAQNGQYHVAVYTVDNTGCFLTLNDTILVTNSSGGWLNCFLTVDTVSSNGGYTYQFTPTHYGNTGLASMIVDFGDGTYGTLQNSYTHTYTKGGKYYVGFYGTDSSGCYSTANMVLSVGTYCMANIYTQPISSNPMEVGFGAWITSNSPGFKFKWDFGDGTVDSTSTQPFHTYANYGVYQACFHMESTIPGACSFDSCLTVMVYSHYGTCVTDFNADTLGAGAIAFSPVGSVGSNPTAMWSFGDGTTSTQVSPTHTYAKNGTYHVSLQVIDSTGCLSTVFKPVFVSNATGGWIQPIVFMSYQDSGVNTIAFNSQVYGMGNGVTYVWSFGDGGTDTTANPLYTYAQPGMYTVFLQVMDSAGNYAYDYQTIYVGKFVKSYFSGYPTTGTGAYFTGFASGMPNGQFTYDWNFGDGTTGTGLTPSHVYPAYGIYNVCLTVTDTVNQVSDMMCQPLLISNPVLSNCSAAFTAQDMGSGTYQFADSITGSSFVAWAWDFGDGMSTTTTTGAASHTYANKGQYMVTMTGITAAGCMASAIKTILVTNAAGNWTNCVIAVSVNNPVGSNTITFNTTLYGGSSKTKYFWSFGDNTTDTVASPVHTYPAVGAYFASVSVADSMCYNFWSGQVNVGGVSTATLSGVVSANSTPVENAVVYLVTYFWGSGLMNITDSAFTDSAGHYFFPNAPQGYQYTVKAQLPSGHPLENDYLPTYLGNTLVWSYAQLLYGGTIANAGINMISTSPLVKKSTKIAGKLVSASGNNASIANVPVIVFDAQKKPIAYVYSAADGSFEFGDLGYGTYHVHPEIMNKVTTQANVALTSSKPEALNLKMSVHDQTIEPMTATSVEEALLTTIAVYPNPATDAAVLSIELAEPTAITVEVLDLMGRIQFTKTETAQSLNMALPVSELTLGVYLVRISAQGGVLSTQRLVKE